MKPLLERKGNDGTGIAPLDHKPHLESVQFMKIRGQVVFTKRVPDETVGLFRTPDKDGRGTEGEAPFAEPDDNIDLFICQELLSFFSNLSLDHSL